MLYASDDDAAESYGALPLETAYFEPHLAVSSGQARFSFYAPRRLARWRVAAYVITKDGRQGFASAELLTKKYLSLRLELPGPRREGARGEIKAVLRNETEWDLSGSVRLSAESDGKDAREALGLRGTEKSFKAGPLESVTLSWPLQAPRGAGGYKIKARAESGPLVDAAEGDY